MKKLYITGLGLSSEVINHLNILENSPVADLPDAPYKEIANKAINSYRFRSKKSIAKEDLSLLNNISKLAIDASIDAFDCFNSQNLAMDPTLVPVFSATDNIEINYQAIVQFYQGLAPGDKINWDELGHIKEYMNPLDLLRLLNTNTVYHLSKVFGFQGGGYPISAMSLSGLIALQTALYNLKYTDATHALVCASADMQTNENLALSFKLGMVKDAINHEGIVPSYSAASLFVSELESMSNDSKLYAELIDVRSHYDNQSNLTLNHWLRLYAELNMNIKKIKDKLTIILYDNGSLQMKQSERKALASCFPNCPFYSYKAKIGYTGKANNLMDLILSLTDCRIKPGSYVLINGIGMGIGVGVILIKKLRNMV